MERATQRERKPAVTTIWPTLSGIFYKHHPTDGITHTTAFVNQSWSIGWNEKYLNGSTMKDSSHHKWTRSYTYQELKIVLQNHQRGPPYPTLLKASTSPLLCFAHKLQDRRVHLNSMDNIINSVFNVHIHSNLL